MTTYNLDRMAFTPGNPPTFNPAETPQGAEWWAAHRDCPDGQAIVALMTEMHDILAAMAAKHMAREAA